MASDVPSGDWQRWQDEIQRCHLLSAPDGVVVTSMSMDRRNNDARYYTDRARVLTKVGPERGVAFLREELLHALAGELPDGAFGRWHQLYRLEHGRPAVAGNPMVDLMNAGVEKLVAEGVADQIAEAHRHARDEQARHLRTLSCTWCQGNNGCNGACM